MVVAVRDLPAGHRVEPGDVRRRSWPAALVPAGALSSLDDGVVVAAPVVAGEPVVRSRLGRAGPARSPPRLAAGDAAVTLPVGDTPPPVAVGDRVDLVAAGERAGGAGRGPRRVRGRRCESGPSSWPSTADELPAVAGGLVDGTVVVAVSGDPPRGP